MQPKTSIICAVLTLAFTASCLAAAPAPQPTTRPHESLADLQKKSDQGDIRATCDLALRYLGGKDTELDLEKGRALLEKAANGGNTAAMDLAGDMYRSGGWGAGIDIKKAIAWYQLEIKAGSPWGMYTMGHLFQEGTGVPKDLTQAHDWFAKAKTEATRLAATGDVEAMDCLGWIYFDGDATEPNYPEAFHWLKKAADAGNVDAMCGLGDMYTDGKGVQPNDATALGWYGRAADLGFHGAMEAIGSIYADASSPEFNHPLALIWFRKAADRGNILAIRAIGMAYESGSSVEVNLAEAAKWYARAAELGDPESMYKLGRQYQEGQGLPQDIALATQWITKAADAGLDTAKIWVTMRRR